jgi:hypothetical protein
MMELDELGRFVSGNKVARTGRHARAARLTPDRRKEIARAGWDALVQQRFDGDEEAARHWLDVFDRTEGPIVAPSASGVSPPQQAGWMRYCQQSITTESNSLAISCKSRA